MRELTALGVEVEPERWWDENQSADILHYVGRPPSGIHVRLAHQKGIKVVMTENLDQTASRSKTQLLLQKSLTQVGQKLLPGLTGRLAWDVYRELDAMVYVVPHEWDAAKYLFGARPDRGTIIPHGLPADALATLATPAQEGDYLISIATIARRKNTVLLAEAARLAQVPIVFLGKPYSEEDPYFRRFKSLVDDKFVRYPGFVSTEEKFRLIREARGFAILSEFESGCIALYEGAAAGLPLILSQLPWAQKVYAEARAVHFVPLQTPEHVALHLARIYPQAHRLSGTTFPLLSWRNVAERYLDLYRRLLAE